MLCSISAKRQSLPRSLNREQMFLGLIRLPVNPLADQMARTPRARVVKSVRVRTNCEIAFSGEEKMERHEEEWYILLIGDARPEYRLATTVNSRAAL